MKPYIIATLATLALLAFAWPTESQIQNTECTAAETWHLREALHYANRDLQTFHLNAADAAKELAPMSGAPCAGWKIDATAPSTDGTRWMRGDAP